MVQISISRTGKFQSTEANVVQGFIVDAKGFIGVFHLKYEQTCISSIVIQINVVPGLFFWRKNFHQHGSPCLFGILDYSRIGCTYVTFFS